MKWSSEYPRSEGWYWLKNKGSEYVEIKKFYKNENTGQLFTSDEDFYEYYAKDVYSDHLFAGPITKPED